MEKGVARDTRGATAKARSLRTEAVGALDGELLRVVREISSCTKRRDVDGALEVRTKAVGAGLQSVAVNNAVLHACRRAYRWDHALDVWNSMDCRDLISYTTMLSCCAFALQSGTAERIWEEMRQHGLTPNLITYTTMVDVYSACGNCSKALQLFAELKSVCQPDAFAFLTVMSACARVGNYGGARELFMEMTEVGIAPSAAHFNTLIVSCAAERNAETAEAILRTMPHYGVRPRSEDYTALLSCCLDSVQRCRALLQEMRDAGLRITKFTLQEVASAEMQAGEKERARAVIREAIQKGAWPTPKLRRFAAELGMKGIPTSRGLE